MSKREEFWFIVALWPIFFILMGMVTVSFWDTPGLLVIIGLAALAFIVLGGRITRQAYLNMKAEKDAS